MPIVSANAVLAFLLELVVYAAVCFWGFASHHTWPTRLSFGIGGPLLLIAVWAMFGAPTASYALHGLGRALLKICWFGAGAAAIAASLGRRAAAIFVVVYLVSTAIQNF
jgi:uncharacterized protein DUF2568